jgi:hypothetical protein
MANAEFFLGRKLVSRPLTNVVSVKAVGQFEKANLPSQIARGAGGKTINTVVVMEQMLMTFRERRQQVYPETLPEKEWFTIIADISLAALELYTEMGAVYMDYKRNNVMCNHAGQWKVIDVGSIETTKGMSLDKILGHLLRPIGSNLTRESFNLRRKGDLKLPRAPQTVKKMCETIRTNCRAAKAMAQEHNKPESSIIKSVLQAYAAGITNLQLKSQFSHTSQQSSSSTDGSVNLKRHPAQQWKRRQLVSSSDSSQQSSSSTYGSIQVNLKRHPAQRWKRRQLVSSSDSESK